MNKLLFSFMGTLLLCVSMCNAQDSLWTSDRPDGHAPISLMGDHFHKKGALMFSYRYMAMEMEGTLSNSRAVSAVTVFENYIVTPLKMQMNMHMIGAMYAPTSSFTLAIMGRYMSNTMDLQTKMGRNFSTSSEGLGDLSISGLLKLINKNRQLVLVNLGLSLPTGAIDQRATAPMMENAALAYPMQLGSGTLDPFFGATYTGQSNRFSWGLQSKYKFRIGNNSENYSLGNRFDLVGWGAIKASNNLSFSASLSYFNSDKIKGADTDLDPMMMPLFNTANSGRSQWDVGMGTNYIFPDKVLENLRFSAEIKMAVAQNIEGIQMKNKWLATFGLQYALSHH